MWNECLAPKLVDESDEFDELEVVEKIIVLLIPNTNMIGVYFIPTKLPGLHMYTKKHIKKMYQWGYILFLIFNL
jgi:hypothetical protein